jgi:hypothetical protein
VRRHCLLSKEFPFVRRIELSLSSCAKATEKPQLDVSHRSIKPGFNVFAPFLSLPEDEVCGVWILCSILSIGTAITPPQRLSLV